MLRRILLPLIGAFALALTALAAPVAAHAEDDNAVGSCLSADKVWLLVVTDTGEVLANECVGTPATGTDALVSVGLELARDDGNFICAIGGHPAQCPATFTGQYWGSYMGVPGEPYAYAQVGPDENKPKPGTIEAWCYNKADEKECTPPYLKIVKDGAEVAAPDGVTTVDLAVTGEAPSPTASPTATDAPTAPAEKPADSSTSRTLPIVLGIVILGAVAVAVFVSRKKSGKGGAVGGR
ncbi:MAG: hypothetical protein IPJ61_12035 [Tessaracoccus sp.]|uniref:hypothetical protein n=1 Tax=Tessaracoccus sp. TaxID=1971211 RepID=UPI001EB43601|nr:hypothetical protein [Tessaracoccus sp.]MBK7821771.1 hypothetical protein [Tessaracoccus sp.]